MRVALAFLAACTVATPAPLAPRAPSEGVPTSGWYPWLVAPAVLCVTGQPPQWRGEKWSCL